MRIPHDIEAEIYFLKLEEGGRSTPAFNDYRPQFYYEGHDWDARHVYPDVNQVNPGDTVRAYLGFLSPAEHWGKLYPNMKFEIREGARIVGRGKITQILELEESANRAKKTNA
jgi:translation elongation factor EF-Tu-like GTPase